MIIFARGSCARFWPEFSYIVGWFIPPLENLSRMMGNYQVRFLGDKGGEIRLSYPTENPTNMKIKKNSNDSK
jgi:hypothetical protein